VAASFAAGAGVESVGAGLLTPTTPVAAAHTERFEARVCAARQRTGWSPRLIAGETGVAHSIVHAISAPPRLFDSLLLDR
jgi:hypothetical protein